MSWAGRINPYGIMRSVRRWVRRRVVTAALIVAIFSLEGMLPSAMGVERAVTKGVFLVAEARLTDPNFSRSVVLIIHHGQTGSLGVVINRPTTTRLSRLLPDIRTLKDRPDLLYFGGPVMHDALVMLLRSPDPPPSSVPIFEDVYFSQSIDGLTDVLRKGASPNAFRIYAGYAGWAPGQLEAELVRGDWRVIPGDPGAIFEKDPDTIWPEMIRRSSRQFIHDRRPPTHGRGLGAVH